jgi:membrane-associated protein
MGIINQFFDFILHLDVYLLSIVNQYGVLAYLFIFAIIFFETALVLTPFLPGDSLIFTAGAIAAQGAMNIWVLFLLMCIAAILGDTVNYWIGNFVGPKVFKYNGKLLNKEYLERTHKFFDKHGGKTVILARFFPIIRTFAPFLAGVGKMDYWKFLVYNVVGGILWVGVFTGLGYFFGNIQFVKDNFTWFIAAIIIVSLIPAVYHFFQSKMAGRKTLSPGKNKKNKMRKKGTKK